MRAPRDDPDLRGGLLSATRTAEAVAKDAELVRISILDDGTFAVASYEFASVKIHNTPEPAGVMRRCIVVVGSHASITHEHCMALGREIRPPRCSLAQVKARLKIGADLDRVEYDYTVWWRVRTVDRKKHVDTMSMKDDC